MTLIRYTSTQDPDGAVGVVRGDHVFRCAPRLGDLLALSRAEIEAMSEAATSAAGHPLTDVRVLPPLDADTEVWGAGVTYQRSRDARVLESASADVYSLVYEAARPELFFKSVGRQVVTDGDAYRVGPSARTLSTALIAVRRLLSCPCRNPSWCAC